MRSVDWRSLAKEAARHLEKELASHWGIRWDSKHNRVIAVDCECSACEFLRTQKEVLKDE